MFVNDSILNPKQVFELPNIKETLALKGDSLPNNWLNQLCEGLNKLSNETLLTRALLSKHLDGTYTHKESLLDSLAFIYQSMKEAIQEEIVSDEIKSRFTTLTTRLVDGIEKCTPGFHNRVNSIVLSLQRADESVVNMLFNFRMSIVEKAAYQISSDVHVFNRFYCIANTLGLGVTPISKQDPYPGTISDEVIESKLEAIFLSEYTPLKIIDYLLETTQAQLRGKGCYEGRKESGYAQADYEAWIVNLQNFLGKESKVRYDLCLLDEEGENPIDINYFTLFRLLYTHLRSQKWILTPLAELLTTSRQSETSIEDLNLLIAIRFNDWVLIKEAFKKNINPNLILREQKESLLMWAIRKDLTDIAIDLINKGAKCDKRNKDGNTGLIFATAKGNTDIALALIQNDAKLDGRNNQGNTALMLAIDKCNQKVALAIIKKGVNLDEKNNQGDTALIIAVANGNTPLALALIKNGAKLDEISNDGNTALIFATAKGNTDIALALIKKGAKLDKKNNQGDTALLFATHRHNTNIALALIQNDAKLNERNNQGNTALILAIKRRNDKVALALIEKRASLDETNNHGDTPLIIAISNGNTPLALILIKRGAKLDEITNDGNTALIFAVAKGNADVVLALIEKGSDLDVRNDDGKTALIAAQLYNHTDIVCLLINAKKKRMAEKNTIAFFKIEGKNLEPGDERPQSESKRIKQKQF
jgi:ankyrin repeat protein